MTLAFLRYTPIVEWHLGPLSISPHGLGTAVGFLAGARLLLATNRRPGVDDQLVYAALTRGGIGAVIGARVAYVVNHLGTFDSPLGSGSRSGTAASRCWAASPAVSRSGCW